MSELVAEKEVRHILQKKKTVERKRGGRDTEGLRMEGLKPLAISEERIN